jgi:hypothetical protein
MGCTRSEGDLLGSLPSPELKWDALFLVATGGLIAADKHVTGAISHNNLTVSQNISDIGLYSPLATTGVLYLSIARKDEHARETGFLACMACELNVKHENLAMAGRLRLW